MYRRRFCITPMVLIGLSLTSFHSRVNALNLSDISNAQASDGLKRALEKGALAAVSALGQANGFMGNERVRIALPNYLEDAAKLLRGFGQGARLDALILAMNQAAEAAVPLARDMLLGAVKSINVQDAKKILLGSETAVTEFFAEKTRLPLSVKFLPIVTKTTAHADLAGKYNQVAGKAASMGLIKGEQASIEQYVTSKTLDGLYLMIGEEEKKIRRDPVASGSALLQKVFGALNR